MWTMLTDDKTGRPRRMIFILDDDDEVHYSRPSLAALVAYRDAHGDCKVPRGWRENPKLATWVGKQRQSQRKGALSEERIRGLDKIGFVSDRHFAQWEEMFAALVAYKDAHGDCRVPARWPENRKLGLWVGTQRVSRMKGALSEERTIRLDKIGFRRHLRNSK